jgi:8-oxo-dGTP pyrophosphatase MutT (NUDIX family)
MIFTNRPNTPHEINGRIVWESRSVAVVCVIVLLKNNVPYILVSKRGPKSPDFIGKMNLVAGYLDWDENGRQAVTRECWEETGFDLNGFVNFKRIFATHLENPWQVSTTPKNNLQNVTLRYGKIFKVDDDAELPKLTTAHNEVEGETEDPMWMPFEDILDYEWAFDHDKVIKQYIYLNNL